MLNPKKAFLASLAIIGTITLVVVLVSVVAFPSSYDTPIKISILAVTALTGALAIIGGMSSVFDFYKTVFTPKTQVESVRFLAKINNVPRPNIFVGRFQELNVLNKYLLDKKVKTIVITGIGGIGKSTLAQQAVYSSIKNYPGGAAWLSVRDFPDFSIESAIKELGKVFNLGGSDDIHQLLIRYFQLQPSIVVFDNLESLSAQEILQVRGFIDQISTEWGNKFILTLRPPVQFIDGKSDEKHFHVNNGLDFDNAKKYLEMLVSDDSSIKDDLLQEVEWVINRIEGHPKMLEIVAGITRHRGWNRVRPLILSLSGELQEKMHNLYSGSVKLLNQEGQKVLPYLPLFLIPRFTYDSVAAACGDTEKEWSYKGLDQVCDSGLVSFSTVSGYCAIHQTVIDYINNNFPLSRGERISAYSRLMFYYGNQGNLYSAVLMWREATEQQDVSVENAMRNFSEPVRAMLKTSKYYNKKNKPSTGG